MIEVLLNTPLSQKTFYGIGGPADEFYTLNNTDGLGELWAETIAQNIPKVILGKGSNIVFSDKGFRGRVFCPAFKNIDKAAESKEKLFVTAEAGASFQTLIETTNKYGYADLCSLSGIPGNVGGFIRGNAGAYGVETSDFVVDITYLDEQGQIQKISHKKALFGYRGSIFKQNPDWLILKATFGLYQKDLPKTALEKTKQLLTERWEKYPAGRSGGCIFKNPDPKNGLLAGKILDSLGAKGDRSGDIQIAKEHANFFVNTGQGKQADICRLIHKWQKRVYASQQIKLEPEVFIVDEYGKPVLF